MLLKLLNIAMYLFISVYSITQSSLAQTVVVTEIPHLDSIYSIKRIFPVHSGGYIAIGSRPSSAGKGSYIGPGSHECIIRLHQDFTPRWIKRFEDTIQVSSSQLVQQYNSQLHIIGGMDDLYLGNSWANLYKQYTLVLDNDNGNEVFFRFPNRGANSNTEPFLNVSGNVAVLMDNDSTFLLQRRFNDSSYIEFYRINKRGDLQESVLLPLQPFTQKFASVAFSQTRNFYCTVIPMSSSQIISEFNLMKFTENRQLVWNRIVRYSTSFGRIEHEPPAPLELSTGEIIQPFVLNSAASLEKANTTLKMLLLRSNGELLDSVEYRIGNDRSFKITSTFRTSDDRILITGYSSNTNRKATGAERGSSYILEYNRNGNVLQEHIFPFSQGVDSISSITQINGDYIATGQNSNGKPILMKLLPAVSVKEHNTHIASLSILPNPSSETISVTLLGEDSIHKIEVVDINGRVVLEKQQRSGIINIQSLPIGHYLLTVTTTSGKRHSQVFVISR